MVLIKVQYDAYNRQFMLVDRELAHLLDDGETYVLLADVSLEDLKPVGDLRSLSSSLPRSALEIAPVRCFDF